MDLCIFTEARCALTSHSASSFREFQPAQVTTPVCAQYLKQFAATPRTHNMHRSILRQVLAFGALEGLREGYTPINNIQTKRTPGRRRLVTGDEIELLKEAALQAARNGLARGWPARHPGVKAHC